MTSKQREALKSFPIGGQLNNRIKLALILDGMTIRELARIAKVNRKTIEALINGLQEGARIKTAFAIAHAFDLEVEDLFPTPIPWEDDE